MHWERWSWWHWVVDCLLLWIPSEYLQSRQYEICCWTNLDEVIYYLHLGNPCSWCWQLFAALKGKTIWGIVLLPWRQHHLGTESCCIVAFYVVILSDVIVTFNEGDHIQELTWGRQDCCGEWCQWQHACWRVTTYKSWLAYMFQVLWSEERDRLKNFVSMAGDINIGGPTWLVVRSCTEKLIMNKDIGGGIQMTGQEDRKSTSKRGYQSSVTWLRRQWTYQTTPHQQLDNLSDCLEVFYVSESVWPIWQCLKSDTLDCQLVR